MATIPTPIEVKPCPHPELVSFNAAVAMPGLKAVCGEALIEDGIVWHSRVQVEAAGEYREVGSMPPVHEYRPIGDLDENPGEDWEPYPGCIEYREACEDCGHFVCWCEDSLS